MSQKLSGESFIAVVNKSGLIDPQRLTQMIDGYVSEGGDRSDALRLADLLVDKSIVTRWQAEKLLQGKHKGYFLGKYRLLSLLGRGGMSSVYLAEHVLMRRRCAIKVLPAKRVGDSSYLARFHREAQAVASLDHPNIVRAYDVDQQSDRDAEIHFLVMEYVEGCSLQELVTRDGPTPFADAADYIRQAALGLSHAHRANLVHRDIKPGNLLLDKRGTVKILDLGLARFFDDSGDKEALTIQHDEKVLGTADYLAPEQALDSHKVDARADIYSLGCTFYFLLTGHPPFTEGTLAQRLMAHQTKEPPPVENDRPDVPPSLLAILKKMIAKQPADRYSSAAENATVLLEWLDKHADPAWRASHSGIFSGLAAATPRRASPVAARVVAPIAKPVAGTASTSPAPVAAESEPASGESAAGEPELAAFFAGLQTSAKSPSSKKLASGSSIHPEPSQSPSDKSGAPSSMKGPKSSAPSSRKLVAPPEKEAVASRAEAVATEPTMQAPAPEATTSAEPAPPAGPDFSFLTEPVAESAEATVPWTSVEDETGDEPAPMSIDEATIAVEPGLPSAAAAPEPAVKPVAEAVPETVPEAVTEATPAIEIPPPEVSEEQGAFSAEPMFVPGQFPEPAISISTSGPARSASKPRTSAPSVADTRAKGSRPSLPSRQILMIGGAAAALVILIGVAGSLLGWFGASTETKKVAKGAASTEALANRGDAAAETGAKAKGTVAAAGGAAAASWRQKRETTVGPGGEYPTITAALEQVKANFDATTRSDRFLIKVAAGTYTERITLADKNWSDRTSGANIVIRGEGAVILQPSGADPVIRLNSVTGVQLINLTVRAQGQPVAIELAESLDRCLLQRVRIDGYGDAGIVLSGALGSSFSNDRLTLDGVECRGAAGTVGLRASKGTQKDSVDSGNVLLRRCRFLGPQTAGASLRGSEMRAFEFRECIFADASSGVELLDGAAWSEFLFVNNTFYKCQVGVRIAKQPPTSSKGISFRRNLFVETARAEVVIEDGFNETVMLESQMLGPMQGNWTDRPAPETPVPGGLAIWGGGERGQANVKFASTDPQSPKFLAPAPNAPQAKVSGGDPPWVGAVGP